uniref:Si:dkey-146m20.13 n=1 Tax=Poecilia reticulata TaxID=8081 RepID=A0A3P9MT21_POERE
MNPSNYEIILGINNQHHHWTLVEKKSLFLNPLGESKHEIQKCLQITRYGRKFKSNSIMKFM